LQSSEPPSAWSATGGELELVVVDVPDALGRQVAVETFVELMRRSRAAVEQQQADLRDAIVAVEVAPIPLIFRDRFELIDVP